MTQSQGKPPAALSAWPGTAAKPASRTRRLPAGWWILPGALIGLLFWATLLCLLF